MMKSATERRTSRGFRTLSKDTSGTGGSLGGKRQGRSSVLFGRPSGPLRSATSALANERYFWTTVLVATPPLADFTQTDVTGGVAVPSSLKAPPGLVIVVMRAPVQAPPTAGPLWISTVAAKMPLTAVVVPSTRSRFWATTNSARAIETVSAAA